MSEVDYAHLCKKKLDLIQFMVKCCWNRLLDIKKLLVAKQQNEHIMFRTS